MKTTLLIFVGILIPIFSYGASQQDLGFSVPVKLYWCTYKKIPKSIDDLSKVTDIKNVDQRVIKELKLWLEKVDIKGDGDEIIITYTKPHPSGDPVLSGSVKIKQSCNEKKI